MAYILCIETTTTNCSVSIALDGKTIALQEENRENYSHSENLHGFISKALEKANISKSQIDAVAVSMGPGSYTGLRIGVSAAKGLCFALEIPLISVDTLNAFAFQVVEECECIIPMLDARRMEVYSCVFDSNKNKLEEIKAVILDETSFLNYLEKGKVVFLGNANEKFKTVCNHPNAVFLEDKLPSANEMAALADFKHKKSDFESVAYFEPYYLKDFIGG